MTNENTDYMVDQEENGTPVPDDVVTESVEDGVSSEVDNIAEAETIADESVAMEAEPLLRFDGDDDGEGIPGNEEGETADNGSVNGDEGAEEESEPEETAEERRLRRKKELIGDVVFFVVSFIIIFTLFKIFPPYRVSGDSMNMTLKDKAFGFGVIWFTPDYGDIIVLHGEKGKTNDDDFIKRIVGKPGDVLDITDGVVVRNGELLTEEYAYYDTQYPNKTGITQHIELGEGEYLVLGDNRYHSMDGRYFGAIKRSEMKCKMLFFLWGKKR